MLVERAFGLLVGRWGIFWKRLLCAPDKQRLVIGAAVRLHNIAQEYACEWSAQDEGRARRRAERRAAEQRTGRGGAAGEDEQDQGTEVDTSASDEVSQRSSGSDWRRRRDTEGAPSHHAAPEPSRARRERITAALSNARLQRPAPRLAPGQ